MRSSNTFKNDAEESNLNPLDASDVSLPTSASSNRLTKFTCRAGRATIVGSRLAPRGLSVHSRRTSASETHTSTAPTMSSPLMSHIQRKETLPERKSNNLPSGLSSGVPQNSEAPRNGPLDLGGYQQSSQRLSETASLSLPQPPSQPCSVNESTRTVTVIPVPVSRTVSKDEAVQVGHSSRRTPRRPTTSNELGYTYRRACTNEMQRYPSSNDPCPIFVPESTTTRYGPRTVTTRYRTVGATNLVQSPVTSAAVRTVPSSTTGLDNPTVILTPPSVAPTPSVPQAATPSAGSQQRSVGRRRSRLGRANTEVFMNLLDAFFATPENQRTLANPNPKIQMNELPSVKFDASKVDSLSNGNSQCPICLEQFEDRESLSYLPCTHRFHQKCIKRWLRRSTLCPICQVDVLTLLQGERRKPVSTKPVTRTLGAACGYSSPIQRTPDLRRSYADHSCSFRTAETRPEHHRPSQTESTIMSSVNPANSTTRTRRGNPTNSSRPQNHGTFSRPSVTTPRTPRN